MITAFSIGDYIHTVLSAKIDKIEVRSDPDGTLDAKYGVKIDYPNGFGDYQWINEEDLLKFIEQEETKNEPKA